jgi:hypothetical protein
MKLNCPQKKNHLDFETCGGFIQIQRVIITLQTTITIIIQTTHFQTRKSLVQIMDHIIDVTLINIINVENHTNIG